MGHIGDDPGHAHRPPRHRPAQDQRAERDHLERGLPLGQLGHRHRNLNAAQKLAQARNGDLAQQDHQPRDHMHVAHIRAGQNPLRGQHEDHGGDHDLVGDRIEEHAQLRDCPLRPREVAVEIVGHPHQAIHGKAERIAGRPARPPQQGHEQRNGKNAREREDIGQSQHGKARNTRPLPDMETVYAPDCRGFCDRRPKPPPKQK